MTSIKLLVLTFMFLFLLDTSVGILSYSELRRLYNSEVTSAEYWTRSLDSGSDSSGSSGGGWFGRRKRGIWGDYRIIHSGIVVTTDFNGGSRWLIHKGGRYGTHEHSSSTVIVEAGYMSGRWTREKCGSVSGYDVNDFMVAGGVSRRYSLYSYNCQSASNSIWNRLIAYDVSC